LFQAIPEISYVYLNALEYQDARWRVCQVHTVDFMCKESLKRIVREKESKRIEYEPCDSYWLLIIVDPRDPAQDQEIMISGLQISSDKFEQIIIYKPFYEEVAVVKS